MSRQRSDESSTPCRAQRKEKRAYEKPRITFLEPLEAVAAFCDPAIPPPLNGKASAAMLCNIGSS